LLWVLGEAELEASDDRRRFYEVERSEWSNRLALMLDLLEHVQSVDEELANLDDSPADGEEASAIH
jgi:hypothetical protein